MVKRSVLAIVISACMMVGNSVFAADIDSMTLEELKTAITAFTLTDREMPAHRIRRMAL